MVIRSMMVFAIWSKIKKCVGDDSVSCDKIEMNDDISSVVKYK